MRGVLLPLVVALAGCSGFSIAPRQDKDDARAFGRVVREAPAGRPFAARELLEKDWARMWVFPDGIGTQEVEDRIGIPFPQSGEEPQAEGSGYVVFDDGETVVSAFVPPRGVGVEPACLSGDRRPIGPGARVVVVGSPPRLATVGGATRCG